MEDSDLSVPLSSFHRFSGILGRSGCFDDATARSVLDALFLLLSRVPVCPNTAPKIHEQQTPSMSEVECCCPPGTESITCNPLSRTGSAGDSIGKGLPGWR